MFLNKSQLLFAAVVLAVSPAPASSQARDEAAVVRRVAATVQLAAQEYGLGVADGKVVQSAEVEEARLFLSEAARAITQLPDGGGTAPAAIEVLLGMVQSVAPPDSVMAGASRLLADLAARYGVSLDEVPAFAPSLARGAVVFQARCASCHGQLGRGDGPSAADLDPAPTNLGDAEGLRDASPLDFFRRVTIGVAGTAMPSFEATLSADDRWAAALYASTLRLPAASGRVPPALTAFATTAPLSDARLLETLGPGATLAQVAGVRAALAQAVSDATRAAAAFDSVRRTVASAVTLARAGQVTEARQVAFDAYLVFEQVEREVRAKDAGLAGEAEAAFAALRESAVTGGPALESANRTLAGVLERAERVVGDRLSPLNLFVQSLILLLREGLEAILVIGALLTFLVKVGAGRRRRDIHIGVGAAIGASLLTAVVIETVFRLTPARQELLEGLTMAAAAAMLFYVSYWLLTKIEVAKWNAFVKSRVQDAVTSGSALALAAVAFLAVYREGFETVLFYKALIVSGGGASIAPVLAGMALGAVVLAITYVAISRFGVRLPLKPFFAVTSAFLYYMAFVFAGKAVAELQEGGLVATTFVAGGPRLPAMGIYPTVESLGAQGVLVGLAAVAMGWIFVVGPGLRRRRARPEQPLEPVEEPEREVLRSLERIDADLAEARAEVGRLKDRVASGRKPASGGARPAS